MKDKTILNIVRANPEIEFVVNCYRRNPPASILSKLLKVIYCLPVKNRRTFLGLVSITTSFVLKKKGVKKRKENRNTD